VVRAACKAIFGGRFYPSTFMQKDGGLPQFPSGRYTFVGGTSAFFGPILGGCLMVLGTVMFAAMHTAIRIGDRHMQMCACGAQTS